MFALAIDPHLLLAADPLGCLLAFEIQHHAHLQVLKLGHWLIAVVIGDEPIEPEAQFVGEDEVVLSE